MTEKILVSEIKVPALPDYVAVVRLAVGGIVSRMNFTADQIEDIKVAVSEACTNAVQYAYPKTKKDCFVDIKIIQHNKAIEIIVTDTGVGFDPDHPPRRKLHDEDIHMGLGLVFMRNLMEKVKISSRKNKGTTVSLFKKVK